MSLAERPSRGVTRRTFLQAVGVSLAAGLTAITDDFARLMRWCCFGGGMRFAGAG